MIGVIAEHLKTHRHQLGKHALMIGSSVKIPPRDVLVSEAMHRMALDWAAERVADSEGTEQVRRALDLMAAEVTDHSERCRLFREAVGAEARPAEGHVRLSRLIKDGYYSTVFLIEPDNMLERALHAQHMEPEKDYHHLIAGLDDPGEIRVALAESTRPAIVKCGGDLESRFLPVSSAEIRAIADQIHDVLQDTFKIFSVFVAMSERDDPFLTHIPREGSRIFWINQLIPMGDATLYDELRIENPASAEYHRFQPHVIELLEARHSSRHLMCREPGTFNEFFAKVHTRLVRQRHHRRGQKLDLTVLRGGPYRFLSYFDLEDEDFYFGREQDVQAVTAKVREHPITVVFGKAAIGKTSLLRAGVMSALRRESEEADRETTRPWLLAYTRVGDDPVASMRASVLQALSELGYEPGDLTAEKCLATVISRASELCGRRVLILLDQFAEYHVKLGDRMKARFRESLHRCLDECGDDFRLLIAIREDFVGELYELQDEFPQVMHNMHRLHRLTREQATDAIIKPAQNFELQIKRTLVERIINDLYREGVEPAQLQIVCHSIYEGRSPGSHHLGERIYDELGGAAEILDKYLERSLNLLPPQDRRIASKILVLFAGASELKAAQTTDRILAEANADRELVDRVVARLIDLGLIRPVGKGRRRGYELVHEILADKIQKDLAGKELATRDLQDLLTREMNNYTQFGLLIPVEELRQIDSARTELVIGPDELKLIIRSALTSEHETDYWLGRLLELGAEKADFLAALLRDENPQVRLQVFKALGEHLEPRLLRHLVHALEDDLSEIRTLATTHLTQLEPHLLGMLDNPDTRVRALAARALGRIHSRRAVKGMLTAFVDGDDDLRDEITEALLAIDDPRAPASLLRAVAAAPEPAWGAAYALGRISLAESDLKALQRAVKARPKPELHYALAIARTMRRNFEEAAEALAQARQAATDTIASDYIAAAERDLRHQRKRAAAGEDAWLMFGFGPAHGANAAQEVAPPLELAWEFPTKDNVVASPVVRDNTVFIGSRDKHLYAVDTGKGTARWTFEAPDRIEGAAALAEGLVCFGTLSGSVHALDVVSGEQRWKAALEGAIRSDITLESGRLFIGTRAGNIASLDAATGEVVWSFQLPGEVSASIAVAGGILAIGCWDGTIRAHDATNADERWVTKTLGPVSSSPAIADGIVYCGSDDHRLYALRLSDGAVVWQADLEGQVRSSPAVGDDIVVIGSTSGHCYGIRRENGAIAWAAEAAEEIMSSPAIAGEYAYVGSRDGALYALDLRNGDVLWRHATSYGMYSSPAIAEQTVFVGLDYYNLAAFRPRIDLGASRRT
jgi:outer membrane protein assembly factor BamB/HEAT repeat protein